MSVYGVRAIDQVFLPHFDEVDATYRPRVTRFFLRKGHSHDQCEDLTQQTFLRLARGNGHFRDRSDFDKWFWTIAFRVHLNAKRDRAADQRAFREVSLDEEITGERRPLADLLPAPISPDTDPHQCLLERECRELLEQGIAELPPKMRRCAMLVIHQGRSVADVARVLQIAEGTVKAHLSNAREKLSKKLEPYFSHGSRGTSS